MNLFTIGTQGRKPDQVAEILRAAGVQVLVDTRATPDGRFDPCRRVLLEQAVDAVGIVFCSVPQLGVPASVREGAKRLEKRDRLPHVLDWYRAQLADEVDEGDGPGSQVSGYVYHVGLFVESLPTALLCYEHDPATCHRSVLAEHLAARVPGLEIVNL